MNTMIAILAAISAGIAVSSVFLLIVDLINRIEVDKNIDRETRTLPILFRLLLPLTPTVERLASHPAFEQLQNKAEARLQMSGIDHVLNGKTFIKLRMLHVLLGLLMGLFCMLNGHGLIALIMLVLLTVYPGVWLQTRIKQRHVEILKALPNMLDLLTLSVEAGKDFMSALRDILKRRRLDALAEEFNRTFSEIQLGKPRSQALKDMSNRVRQPDLTTVLNSIIQAEELGVSIGELLRIQGDLLRNKRFSRAEKLANEAPVKILIPMVLFIFPAVFIILLGPSLLQALSFIMQ